MPDYATVLGKVLCPHCNGEIASEVQIQWGKVPSRYHVEQSIEWLKLNDIVVPPFTLVAGCDSWNCGDRNSARVLAFDCEQFALDQSEVAHCPVCNELIRGVYADISGNVITALVACTDEDITRILQGVNSPADIVEVKDDGTFSPRPDWYDRRIVFVEKFP